MKNYVRVDRLIKSDETKPDASGMVDGSTVYEVDTQKLYIAYKGEWYLQGNSQEDQEEIQEESPNESVGDINER